MRQRSGGTSAHASTPFRMFCQKISVAPDGNEAVLTPWKEASFQAKLPNLFGTKTNLPCGNPRENRVKVFPSVVYSTIPWVFPPVPGIQYNVTRFINFTRLQPELHSLGHPTPISYPNFQILQNALSMTVLSEATLDTKLEGKVLMPFGCLNVFCFKMKIVRWLFFNLI